jgi:hypothetical protein
MIVECLECGDQVAAVPVDGERWDEAEKWSYLAILEHRKEKHGSPADR